jgi:glycosyltransferase involved in cell wall biosynthesis
MAVTRSHAHPRPKVLIVGQGPPTAGGIPTFVTALVQDPLLRSAFDIEYYNTTPSRPKHPAAPTAHNAWLAVVQAWQVFRRSKRVDLVHLNLAPVPTLPLLRALLLVAASKIGGSATIVHAHTGRLPAAADRSRLYRSLLRVLLRVTDEFVVVSQSAYASASRLSKRVHYLPNGIEAGDRHHASHGHPPVVTFVGTVCERKGLLDLRDALVLRDRGGSGAVGVRIVGDSAQEGPGVLEGIMEAYAAAGLNYVEFLGEQDHRRVRQLLEETTIFCLPSHWEGSSLSLLEAMAAGAAVVATDVGDNPEILDGGRAGLLVPPRDPTALARAIDRLVEDPELRRRLGSRARERVERVYGRGRVATRLSELYSDALAGRWRNHRSAQGIRGDLPG